MSRIGSIFHQLTSVVRTAQPQVTLDFGSQMTRVTVNGEVVWNQATALAWNEEMEAVVAVGDQARQLRGKTPARVVVIQPIQEGVVADLEMMTLFLEAVFNQAFHHQGVINVIRPRCKVAVPAGVTPVELNQLKRILTNLGCQVTMVKKIAALSNLPRLNRLKNSHMVLDLGAQTVELGLLTGQEIIVQKTLHSVKGDDFTRVIMDEVKQAYGCEIGFETAQKIQEQIGVVSDQAEAKLGKMTVRGKNTKTGTMMTIRVEAAVFALKFYELAKKLSSEISGVLIMSPAELVTQALEQGIYLTGGVAQLAGLAAMLENELQTQVLVASSPDLDVVKSMI